ncbi:MAG: hypothetical protein ACU84Q_21795 [Gammaproteobacteria bacterium]
MTEAEAMAALTGLGDQIFAGVDTWLALTFGYLTLAYFVGTKLSRFQCIAVSLLYGIGASLYAVALPIHTHAWTILVNQNPTVYNGTWISTPGFTWVIGSAVFYFAGTILALYFMYDVRSNGEPQLKGHGPS